MTEHGAERAITVSALIVAGIYTYRRLTEGSGPAPSTAKTSKLKQLAGQGSPPSVGTFITAWGFTYLVVSIMASINPGLGGSFAILIAVADALGNTNQVAMDVNGKLSATGATPTATAIQQANAIAAAAGIAGQTSALTANPPNPLPTSAGLVLPHLTAPNTAQREGVLAAQRSAIQAINAAIPFGKVL